MRYTVFIILLFVIVVKSFTQEQIALNTTTYSVNSGLITSPVKNIVKDAYGFMWFASQMGIQRFDGSRFIDVPVREDAKGLPDTRDTKMLNLNNGKLLISHFKGLSTYDVTTHTFKHFQPISIIEKVGDIVIPLLHNKEGVWVLHNNKGLYLLDSVSFNIKELIPFSTWLGLNPVYYLDKKGERFFARQQSDLVEIDLKTKQIVSKIPIQDYAISICLLDATHMMVCYATNWHIVDLTLKKTSAFQFYPQEYKPLKSTTLYTARLSDDKMVITLGAQLWEFDIKRKVFLAEYVNKERRPFIENGYYTNLFSEDDKTFWLASNINGLVRVNNFKRLIKYYGTTDRKLNFTKCLLVDKKCNRVISGTYGQGIVLYDTLQHFIKHIPHINTQLGENNIVTTMANLDSLHCLFFLYGSPNFYILNKITGSYRVAATLKTHLNELLNPGYYNTILPLPNNRFYFCNNLFSYQNETIVVNPQRTQWAPEPLCLLANQDMVFSKNEKIYVYRNFEELNQISAGKTTVKHAVEDKNGVLWVATEHKLLEIHLSPDGVKTSQYSTPKEWTKDNGLPDNTIYAVAVDKKNRLWLSHNKGISLLNGSIQSWAIDDGLQDNEFNTAAVAQSPDGELYFGGVNGISSFYPDDMVKLVENPSVFLSGVKVMGENYWQDTAYWNIDHITLPYSRNILTFDYSTLGLHNADIYNYQVRLVGVDEKWVNMVGLQSARYQLNPGVYQLDLFASRSFDPQAKPLKSITITIEQPYWRTVWFWVLATLAVIGLVSLAITLYYRRKYRQKLNELATQRKIQQEKVRISRDLHDNLGAQLSHIVRSTEWLKSHQDKPNETLLDTVTDTAKEAMSVLRESIWTLNREQITVGDFSDRLKKWTHQIIKSSPNTKLIFKETMGKNTVLNPEQSLQMFRILQEAVNNALKYAQATQLEIHLQSSDNQQFTAQVRDNGIGFNTTEMQGKGNGLENMRHRAGIIKGVLTILSEQGKGTEVTIKIKANV
jgi:signal transduction histidine kinase/ligand-binding sensor domain-containing protein